MINGPRALHTAHCIHAPSSSFSLHWAAHPQNGQASNSVFPAKRTASEPGAGANGRGCSGWSLMVFSFRSSRAPRCSRNPWQTTPQSSDAPCIVRSRTQLSPTEVAVEIRKTGRVARRFLPLLVHSQIKSPPRDYRHTTVRLYIAISRFAAYPQVRLVTGGQFGFGQHRRGENVHAT